MDDEGELQRMIQLGASAEGHRLFRCNTGMGWQGTIVSKTPNFIGLENYRPLHAGLVVGGHDLIGPTRTGLFAAIEVKRAEALRRREHAKRIADQERFRDMVLRMGGRSAIVTSVEEALAELRR